MTEGSAWSSEALYGRTMWNECSTDNPVRDFLDTLHARQDQGRAFWDTLAEAAESQMDVAPNRPLPPPPLLGPGETDHVVYYLRFADRIKIGTSQNVRRRLIAIPHDELLAIEPGARPMERHRHVQFSDLRIRGEWFRYAEPLTSHIEMLRSTLT